MTYCCYYEQQFHMRFDQFANIFHNIYHFSGFQTTFFCGQFMETIPYLFFILTHYCHLGNIGPFPPAIFMGGNSMLCSLLNFSKTWTVVISWYFIIIHFWAISIYSILVFVIFTVQFFFLCYDTSFEQHEPVCTLVTQ